jgi:hypothetical protein
MVRSHIKVNKKSNLLHGRFCLFGNNMQQLAKYASQLILNYTI